MPDISTLNQNNVDCNPYAFASWNTAQNILGLVIWGFEGVWAKKNAAYIDELMYTRFVREYADAVITATRPSRQR